MKNRKMSGSAANVLSKLSALIIAAALFALCFILPIKANAAEAVLIPVEVTYSGSDLPGETFKIELSQPGGESIVREITLTNSVRSGTVEFSLELEAGSYTYTLRELPGEVPGLVYSGKTYTLDITVDASGGVFITATDDETGSEGKPDILRFDNVYTPPSSVIGDPPVSVYKRISGDDPSVPQIFTFAMIPEDPSFPLPEGAVDGRLLATIVGEGSVEFGNILFTEPGVYRYKVVEIDEGAVGYTYDDVVYTVVYTVTEGVGGALSCVRVIINQYENVNACVFTNDYHTGTAPHTGGRSAAFIALAAFGAAAVLLAAAAVRRKRNG